MLWPYDHIKTSQIKVTTAIFTTQNSIAGNVGNDQTLTNLPFEAQSLYFNKYKISAIKFICFLSFRNQQYYIEFP